MSAAAQNTATTMSFSHLHCHASHPDAGRRMRGDAMCWRDLGYVPGRARFADLATQKPDDPDGRIWLRCSRCKSWNVFVVIPPEEPA